MFDSFSLLLQTQNDSHSVDWTLRLTLLGVIIAVIILVYTIKHFYLDKKSLKKEKKELEVKMTKILARPWKGNGMGGWSSSCYIKIDVKNPNSEDNEVEFTILSPESNTIHAKLKNETLPALATTPFEIEFNHKEFNSEEKINTIKGKELLLIIKDIHGKELKQYFSFENMP